MKFLTKGLESKNRINLLLQLTKIGSDNIKSALIDHLTKGLTENDAAMLNGVVGVVEQVKELDWNKI